MKFSGKIARKIQYVQKYFFGLSQVLTLLIMGERLLLRFAHRNDDGLMLFAFRSSQ